MNVLLRRILKNSGYLFSATGITAALGMVQGILAARLLGVAEFGLLGVITMFATVVNKLASFRMNELVVKYVAQRTAAEDARGAAVVFKAALLVEGGTSLLAFALLLALSPLGARYFAHDPATAPWFMLYGGAIVLANLVFESATGLLQISDRFRRIAAIQVMQSLLTLALIALAYLRRGGLLDVVLAYMTGKALGSLGLTAAGLREAHRRWGRGWFRLPLSGLRSRWRELARFAVSTNLSGTLSLINKDSELLWISLLRSPTEAGYYKLALALANLVQMPVSPLPRATYPELSREVARRNWRNVRYVLRQGSRLAFAYTALVALGLAALGRPLIAALYTPEYLPAYPALLILLLGFLVANTFYWNRVALLSLGRADLPAKINFGLALFKVGGILLLVPLWGYLANAGLLAASYLIGVTLAVGLFYRELRRREAASQAGAPEHPAGR